MIEALRKVTKRLHYPIEVMLVCVYDQDLCWLWRCR